MASRTGETPVLQHSRDGCAPFLRSQTIRPHSSTQAGWPGVAADARRAGAQRSQVADTAAGPGCLMPLRFRKTNKTKEFLTADYADGADVFRKILFHPSYPRYQRLKNPNSEPRLTRQVMILSQFHEILVAFGVSPVPMPVVCRRSRTTRRLQPAHHHGPHSFLLSSSLAPCVLQSWVSPWSGPPGATLCLNRSI